MKKLILSIFLALLLPSAQCFAQGPQATPQQGKSYEQKLREFEERKAEIKKNADMNAIQSFGNDVYYIPFAGLDFPRVLSKFLEKFKSEYEIAAIAPDVRRKNRYDGNPVNRPQSGDYGETVGYTVVLKLKKFDNKP